MSQSIKRMSIKEFVEKGFLQEANRKFFHPLGLALEVSIDENDNYSLSSVWDYRDDPEGMLFGDGEINEDKIKYVQTLAVSKLDRRDALGCVDGVQQPYAKSNKFIFKVLENNKPCNIKGFPHLKGYGWENNEFSTFDEAVKYAKHWLGHYGKDIQLQVNMPVDYNGYGDTILISKEFINND